MKYYVRSHNLRVVICAKHIKTPEDAACEVFLLKYNENTIVSPLIIVSERGFDYDEHEHYEDVVLRTDVIMHKAGIK